MYMLITKECCLLEGLKIYSDPSLDRKTTTQANSLFSVQYSLMQQLA